MPDNSTLSEITGKKADKNKKRKEVMTSTQPKSLKSS